MVGNFSKRGWLESVESILPAHIHPCWFLCNPSVWKQADGAASWWRMLLRGGGSLHGGVNSPESDSSPSLVFGRQLRAGPCRETIWRLTKLFSPVSCREWRSNKSTYKTDSTDTERAHRGVITPGFTPPALFCSIWITVAVWVGAWNQSMSLKITYYPLRPRCSHRSCSKLWFSHSPFISSIYCPLCFVAWTPKALLCFYFVLLNTACDPTFLGG